MRAKEFLFELADKPYPFQIVQHGATNSTYGFETDNGSEYLIHVHPMSSGKGFQNDLLNVSFALLQDGETIDTQTGAAGADALRIFSSVVAAVKNSLAERTRAGLDIKYIRFAGSSEEPGRVKLYQRFAKNIGRYLPGWEYDSSAENDVDATFIVKRKQEELDEVEELDYVSKSKKQGFRGPRKLSGIKSSFGAKELLNTGNFSIWRGHERGSSIYYIVDNRTGEAQIQLMAHERNNTLSGLSLFAAPGNTIKAADFYRLLITKLNKVLVASNQSPGSQAVWAKLNKFPDVNIHGWLDGKPVNIDTKDREYAYGDAKYKYIKDPKTGLIKQISPSQELKDATRMKLVAHKK